MVSKARENQAIDALQEVLQTAFKDDFEDGTIIRWISHNDRTDFDYHYAAIKGGGSWWLTGTAQWYGKALFQYQEFVERVLKHANTREVQIITKNAVRDIS